MSSTMVLKDAETALVASAGDPRPERPERPVLRLRIILLEMLWKLFDGVVLFRMGTIYLHRFADFPHAHEVYDDEVDEEISMWRITQQEEWNRLSTSLALLGITNAVISQVTPNTGSAPASLWLGAAGLSLCGLVVVHLISTLAFPMTNLQLRNLVSGFMYERLYTINRTILAMAIAGPPLMMFWSSAFFIAGIVAYIWETRFNHLRYRVFAFLPVAAGITAVFITFLFGNITGRMMQRERSQEGIRRWRKHTVANPPSYQSVWQKFGLWRQYKAERHPRGPGRELMQGTRTAVSNEDQQRRGGRRAQTA